jgi:outer membrane autotransporter protein
LTNNGVLEIGAHGAIGSTTINGDFVQGHDGTLIIDTDPRTGKADIVHVDGRADIDGRVTLNAITLSKSAPFEVLDAAGDVSVPVQAQMAPPGLPIAFKAIASGHELDLQPVADFNAAAEGLGVNQRRVAAQLQGVWDSGASLGQGFAQIAKLNTAADYATTLNSLSGQAYGDLTATRSRETRAYLDVLDEGCAQDRDAARCVWSHVAEDHAVQNGSANALGYGADQQILEVGGRVALADGLSLNGSLGYGSERFSGGQQTASFTGQSQTAAVGVAYRSGSLILTSDLAVSHAGYNGRRAISVGDITGQAQAHPQMWSDDLRLGAAYGFALSKAWTLQPFGRLDYATVRNAGLTESGSTDFNLVVDGQTHRALSGEAGLRFYGQSRLKSDLIVKPSISLSAEDLNGGNWAPAARFASAPIAQSFRAVTNRPRALGKLSAGLELSRTSGWSLQLQYDVQAGGGYQAQSAGGRLTMRF